MSDTTTETYYSCARCGSDAQFEECGFCVGCGYSERNPDPTCPHCHGEGVLGYCVSTPDWCLANPLSIERPRERHEVIEETITRDHDSGSYE